MAGTFLGGSGGRRIGGAKVRQIGGVARRRREINIRSLNFVGCPFRVLLYRSLAGRGDSGPPRVGEGRVFVLSTGVGGGVVAEIIPVTFIVCSAFRGGRDAMGEGNIIIVFFCRVPRVRGDMTAEPFGMPRGAPGVSGGGVITRPIPEGWVILFVFSVSVRHAGL